MSQERYERSWIETAILFILGRTDGPVSVDAFISDIRPIPHRFEIQDALRRLEAEGRILRTLVSDERRPLLGPILEAAEIIKRNEAAHV